MGVLRKWPYINSSTNGTPEPHFPKQVAANPAFTPAPLPVSVDYLRREGLSDPFVEYMRQWKGFVAEAA